MAETQVIDWVSRLQISEDEKAAVRASGPDAVPNHFTLHDNPYLQANTLLPLPLSAEAGVGVIEATATLRNARSAADARRPVALECVKRILKVKPRGPAIFSEVDEALAEIEASIGGPVLSADEAMAIFIERGWFLQRKRLKLDRIGISVGQSHRDRQIYANPSKES